MPRIGLWDTADFEKVSDVLLIRNDDLAAFRAMVADGLIDSPERSFLASPNATGEEQWLLYYLQISLGDEYAVTDQSDAGSFIQLWNMLISRVNNWDARVAANCVRVLKTRTPDILENLRRLLELFDDFVGEVVRPMNEGIYYPVAASRPLTWWKDSPARLDAGLVTFLEKLDGYHDPELAKACDTFRGPVMTIRKGLSRFRSDSPAICLYRFGAFLLGLAGQFCREARFSLTIVTTHRSLDLFFQSVAFDEELLVSTPNGLRYSDGGSTVSLMATERMLMRESRLTPAGTRTGFLRWLNELRNRSLYTHGVHSCDSREAESAVKKAGSLVTKMDGNDRFIKMSREFFPDLNLGQSLIFDVEPAFDTYVDEL